ncbi:MAG: pinensin family lanthipeptide [Candidatus Aminicenantes bacterium]|nr:MAG: pinensin family lanthipeptide [Candidatus Aminicenantes bacterium]
MEKKERLHLEAIKVESFVTLLSDEEKERINGGTAGADSTTLIRVFCKV